jgi:parvulin-like peptidyl-prolyl isomerase
VLGGDDVHVTIPPRVDRFELPPIEITHSHSVQGRLFSADGRPLAVARIRGTWRAADGHAKAGVEVTHWTRTDDVGHFLFENIAGGTALTVLPVRAGVPLSEPVQTLVGDDKPVQLHEKKEELVALAGRVLDADRKPIPGAQVVVEVADSPDRGHLLVGTVDANGSFRTPAQFPKRLKYRLTVRSMLDVVASTDWGCPAFSGTQFPDLIADRGKLGLGSKLTGKETVARVEGQPIYAYELFQRALIEPLGPNGCTLLGSVRALEEGVMPQAEFRALQEAAIKKFLGEFIRNRALTQAFLAKLNAEQKKSLEEAVAKEFDSYVERLKKYFHVATRDELDSQLQKQGASLDGIRREFRYKLLSDEYLRSNRPDSDVIWSKALAHYDANRNAYVTCERVNWQLLEINFDRGRMETAGLSDGGQSTKQEPETFKDWATPKIKGNGWLSGTAFDSEAAGPNTSTTDSPPREKHTPTPEPQTRAQERESDRFAVELDKAKKEVDALVQSAAALGEHLGPEKARKLIDDALKQLHEGKSFEAVAKKFSDGPWAEQGGWQPPTNPASIADEKTADALRRLAEGETSPVIQTDHSLRIVRAVSRIPAGHKTFEEVEKSIRELLQHEWEQKAVQEAFERASIEWAFTPDGAFQTDGAFVREEAPPELPKWGDNPDQPRK